MKERAAEQIADDKHAEVAGTTSREISISAFRAKESILKR